MHLGIEGDGVLARAVRGEAERRGWVVTAPDDVEAEAVVRATPLTGERPAGRAPTVAAAVRQSSLARAAADLPVAGWWGGLGTLLGRIALGEAEDAQELHAAYGLLGARTALRHASPTVRREIARAAMEPAEALVRGEVVPEPLGEGRRLAWFPAPVGPAHAVAVGGLEHATLRDVPTVRTWVAAGSLAAEALQAVGRRDPDSGVGAWLVDRAAARGGGPGATADARWAVVVEVRDHDGEVVRAWANGTDPVACTAVLLAGAADRARAVGTGVAPTSLLDLAPAGDLLDELADARALRWSVGRPTPSPR